jgi:hypothetical protein
MCVCTPLEVLQCYNLGKTEGFSSSECYKSATDVLQGVTAGLRVERGRPKPRRGGMILALGERGTPALRSSERGRERLPWEHVWGESSTPTGLCLGMARGERHNPVGVGAWGRFTQRSSGCAVATLGFGTESRWDSRSIHETHSRSTASHVASTDRGARVGRVAAWRSAAAELGCSAAYGAWQFQQFVHLGGLASLR